MTAGGAPRSYILGRMSPGKILLAAAALVVAATLAYAGYSAHQKREQQHAIAALVEAGSRAATEALQGEPSAAQAGAIRQALEQLPEPRAARQRAMAQAADQYLTSCRAIVER